MSNSKKSSSKPEDCFTAYDDIIRPPILECKKLPNSEELNISPICSKDLLQTQNVTDLDSIQPNLSTIRKSEQQMYKISHIYRETRINAVEYGVNESKLQYNLKKALKYLKDTNK